MIPFVRLSHHWEQYKTEYLNVIQEVLDSGQYQGDKTSERFEQKLSEYSGRRAVLVNSGTDALVLALRSLRLDPGSEVIVPAYTFVATGSAVLAAGLKPVFVDVHTDGLLNSMWMYRKMTKNIKAVIGVTLFGQEVETPSLPNGVHYIVDNAQGFNRDTVHLGHLNCLSFDPMKILPAFGSGGAVLCDDQMTEFFLKGLRKNDPMSEVYSQNSQASALTSAILSFRFEQHNYILDEHYAQAETYMTELNPSVTLHRNTIKFSSNHKFPIFHKDRNKLKAFLELKGVQTKIHYDYVLPNLQMFGSEDPTLYPNAFKFSGTELSLPIYPGLTNNEQSYIIESVNEFVAAQ